MTEMKPLISVIVCSTNAVLRENLYANIYNTIGVDFEFLFKNNNINSEGICKVYNDLAKKSNGKFVCFIHEDVIIDTKCWGEILIEQAIKPDTGIIGFAGSKKVTNFPFWFNKGKLEYFFVQRDKDMNLIHDFTINHCAEDNSEVAVLDGMFLFCRRDIWDTTRFDEILFKNFHMYDVDFSFAVRMKFKNFVNHKVRLNHYSLGSLSSKYYIELSNFCQKWSAQLPYDVDTEKAENDLSNISQLFYEMRIKNNLKIVDTWKYLYEVGELSSFINISISIFQSIRVELIVLKNLIIRGR